MAADLLLPSGPGPFPAVLCTHDALDHRASPHNLQLAGVLAAEGIAVMLLDLTGQGESDGTVEDATPEQQAGDVGTALDELERRPDIAMGRVGAFGSGSGALPVTLRAERDPRIRALVLEGPRQPAVFDSLRRVALPTLLLVGSQDRRALEDALALREALVGDIRVAVVPEAEVPQEDLSGFQQAALLAGDWFREHIAIR